ncbi:hypothetical protein [Stigmatella aurantiaca]|uniref:hypothetical protein n=1 Tax=Stigmatella aurantiaca TaxID=41 RepID=UPI0011D2C2D8|nr:hypothetical protein [Stigmatella aurantiaca]
MKRRGTPAGAAEIAVLVQVIGLSGCCPGPRAYDSGLRAFAKARVANRILAVFRLDRTLVAFPPAQDEGTRVAFSEPEGEPTLVQAQFRLASCAFY